MAKKNKPEEDRQDFLCKPACGVLLLRSCRTMQPWWHSSTRRLWSFSYPALCFSLAGLWEAPVLKEAGIKVPALDTARMQKSFSIQEQCGVGSTMQILS